jgi:hypothetical protein
MSELETLPTGTAPLTQREKRDMQKAQLRPLANRRPELYDEDEYTAEEQEAMMEMYNGTMASIEEGEIVKSRVLEIRDNLVVLDIGFKSEGTIPLEEFKDMPELKAGDEVEVSSSTSRTRKGRWSCRRRRRTSCACGSASGSPTRRTSRSRARSSRRSRAAWWSTSWGSTPSSPAPRSRSVACRTSTSCSARSTSSRSSSSTSAGGTSSCRAASSSSRSGPASARS